MYACLQTYQLGAWNYVTLRLIASPVKHQPSSSLESRPVGQPGSRLTPFYQHSPTCTVTVYVIAA